MYWISLLKFPRSSFENVEKTFGSLDILAKIKWALFSVGQAKKEGSAGDDSDSVPGTSEVDIKYKLHLCYLRTNQHNLAADILQSIPAKQRTPKVYQALGRVYQQAGMERPAVTCFKEVLKACPLAIDAAQTLMTLGVKPKEVQALTRSRH